MSIYDIQVKFANKSIWWVHSHYHRVSTDPQINLHIEMPFTPLREDKLIPLKSFIRHSHPPQSSSWKPCFCTKHMNVWEVMQYSLCVSLININYIRWLNVVWMGYSWWNRGKEVNPLIFCSCTVSTSGCGRRQECVCRGCVHTCPRLLIFNFKKI